MLKSVEKALRASIKKWKKNLRAKDPHDIKLGSIDCPLCVLIDPRSVLSCGGCPVYIATKQHFCRGNRAYNNALVARNDWLDEVESKFLRKRFQTHAQKEVDFLESLLP